MDTSVHHQRASGWKADSAKQMVRSIKRDFDIKSAFDIGCGPCCVLWSLYDNGVKLLGGLEQSPEKASYMPPGSTFYAADLTGSPPMSPADLVLCLEVLEHIPAAHEKKVVSYLVVNTSKYLVITAAPPGQPGDGHINCQSREHWIEAFTAAGLWYDKSLTEKWQKEWLAWGVAWHYPRNLMIFKRV